jgi:BatD DUF11 like domain
MKWFVLIIFLPWCAAATAQHSIQTVVPLQPITVGTAFQVQYIVTDNEPAVELQSPAFGKDFRFVSGPHFYQGEAVINNTKYPIQNFSYTLIPLRKGRLVVKGATAVFKSRKVKSDDAFVVATDEEKDPLASTSLSGLPRLAPGATWDAKLQEQLFIKTTVNKQSCFVGEPIVATFTLFSHLPSASEVIKHPGFYGFSVLDIPDAANGAQTVQTYNGTFYNTHVLRKVQLYPTQAGNLLIDNMSVNNAIEYADSASGAPVQTQVVLESKPLTIAVKPLPLTGTESFTGAVGNFLIRANLEKQEWQQNNNGKLVLTISGAGNFLQLTAPEIKWPRGVDVFEPTATERLQKEAIPVSGMRTYTYTFTTDSMGSYIIPPIAFTYFNPAEKKYKTATTDSLHFTVLKGKTAISKPFMFHKNARAIIIWPWLLGGVLLLALFGCALVFKKRAKREKTYSLGIENREPDFEKAIQEIEARDIGAYRQLQQALMGFLKSAHIPVPASNGMLPATAILPTPQQQELQAILEECEAVQYYNAAPTVSIDALQQRALQFMRSVKRNATQAPTRD